MRINLRHPEAVKNNLHKFIYQPETGKLCWSRNFSSRAREGKEAGSVDTYGYRQVRIEEVTVLVHRLIWFMHHGTWPAQVDHINRNRLDNRIENLRESNHFLNMQNTTPSRRNKNGAQGVVKYGNKWAAKICLNKKVISLGSFTSLEEAAKAYANAKATYHPHGILPGEFEVRAE